MSHVEACVLCQTTLANLSEEVPGIDGRLLRADRPALLSASVVNLVRKLRDQVPAPSETRPAPPEDTASAIRFPGPPTPKGPLGQLDTFHIRHELGSGHFGVVYQAVDALDRLVAVKVLKPEFAASGPERARFENEARKAAAVKHDHVVGIYQVGHTPGFPLPYLVMEFIDGESLQDRLRRLGVLEAKEAVRIVQQVAWGLAAAHDQELVHRDIKPSNIVLEEATERAKITDFGLARGSETGGERLSHLEQIVGTPAYMSPEQINAPSTLDARTDVYSLGVVLYELLTAETPFRGVTHMLLQQVVHDEPRPPRKLNDRIPRDLETITLKCLAKEPGRRYRTARALADDLQRWRDGKPIEARPLGMAGKIWKSCRRKPALAAMTVALLLALGAGTAGITWEWHQEQQQRRRAEGLLEKEQTQRELAEQRELTARRHWYDADIFRAQKYWDNGNTGNVLQLLEAQRPGPGQVDLRSFEWDYLWRLCHRDLLTLPGHDSAVLCLAYSPDGETLASAGIDGNIKLWNVKTGKLRAELSKKNDTFTIWALAFAPDGRTLVSGDAAGNLLFWEVGTGRVEFLRKAHRFVRSVVFSSDGKRMVTANPGGTVKLWQWDDLRRAPTELFKGEPSKTQAVVLGPNGAQLALAKTGAVVELKEIPSGQTRITLRGFPLEARVMAFSPDGRILAVGTGNTPNPLTPGEVRLWDLNSGVSRPPLAGHQGGILSVAFSPDGTRLATGSADSTVRFWDTATGRNLATLRGHTAAVRVVAFSPDGQTVATGSADKQVKVWSVTQTNEPELLDAHPGQRVSSLAFAPDGKTLATCGGDQKARLWEVAAGKRLQVFEGHEDRVRSLTFGRDGRTLATVSWDKTVKFWDVTTGRESLPPLAYDGTASAIAFSADGSLLAVAGFDKPISLWRWGGSRWEKCDPFAQRLVQSLAFSPDGRFLTTASHQSSSVRLWDLKTRQGRDLTGHTENVHSVAFSPDGATLASGSKDSTVKLWDVGTGQLRHSLAGHTLGVQAVAFSPDGKTLASATGDPASRGKSGEVKLWDVVLGQERATLAVRGSTGVLSLAFAAHGKTLAAGRADGKVQFWLAADP
jgi:WD40 repeat protein/predicted Ser/Thr protein kinase